MLTKSNLQHGIKRFDSFPKSSKLSAQRGHDNQLEVMRGVKELAGIVDSAPLGSLASLGTTWQKKSSQLGPHGIVGRRVWASKITQDLSCLALKLAAYVYIHHVKETHSAMT